MECGRISNWNAVNCQTHNVMSQLLIGFNIQIINLVGEVGTAILNSLPIIHYQLILITSQVSVTNICGIQPTNAVTMAMNVLHNSCNMCTLDLTGMYALDLGPAALMLLRIYQSNYLCTCYNYNI